MGMLGADASETDQYLTWGVELEDSAEAFNGFLNDAFVKYVHFINRRSQKVHTKEELVDGFFIYLYDGLHYSRARQFIKKSDAVERYPEDSLSQFGFLCRSIYRRPTFPFLLPMCRTFRIGDVYLSTDKISHFFGYGRRYFARYGRLLAGGKTEEEAREAIVRWGIMQESSVVGTWVCGIFSHADMEANYQGFLFAQELCYGEPAYVEKEAEGWKILREIDVRPYITPDFDESYNRSHYFGFRRKMTLPVVQQVYCEQYSSPRVQERFARYATYTPSFSKQYIDAYFEARQPEKQREREWPCLCATKR